MNSKPVIPTPPEIRWREFRLQALPIVIFVSAAACAIFLWSTYVTPTSLVGRVETIQANVVSSKPGALTEMNVTRFQPVKVGDVVGKVVTSDPKVLVASLAVIRAEVDLLKAGASPFSNAQRAAINYEQLQLDWMRERVDLAALKVNMQLADNEYKRSISLFEDKLVSESSYQTAEANYNALVAQVQEQTALVEKLDGSLKRLSNEQDLTSNTKSQLEAAIHLENEKLKLTEAELSPVELIAPIDGLVTLIYRRNGETVTAGEPILTLSAERTDHVIGYLRQPLTLEPRTNMMVQIRTRRPHRESGVGRILAVGAHLQSINEALMPPSRFDTVELGLPIRVSLPPNLKAHPGETVDLTILSQAN